MLCEKMVKFLLLLLSVALIDARRMTLLGDMNELDTCKYERGRNGICRKTSDCMEEFQTYRSNRTVLKICRHGKTLLQNIICCPLLPRIPSNINEARSQVEHRIRGISEPVRKPDLLNFKTCRREMLEYRNYTINPNHFGTAMFTKKIPTNKKNCKLLSKLNNLNNKLGGMKIDLRYFSCHKLPNGTYQITVVAAWHSVLVQRGTRPNMAAVGWTKSDGSVVYRCGGSVITERFIVTAAHCKFYNGYQADTVRIGDRFLITSEDDDIAQQLKILKFIIHPDYKSRYHYNDIAMIKTAGRIHFNQFVVPSCIDDLNSERIGYFTDWSVAGYGETEDGVPSNVLLEMTVYHVPNEKCNETYKNNSKLPKGIIDSQFCVESVIRGAKYPDTCFGDSGSPLQFMTSFEQYHHDFEKSYLSSVYRTSTVLGVVSFGIDCGLQLPSVYTKLEYFKNWMRSVIKYD